MSFIVYLKLIYLSSKMFVHLSLEKEDPESCVCGSVGGVMCVGVWFFEQNILSINVNANSDACISWL